MIWKLAKKDLLLYLMTFKFAVGTIVCVLLTVALMPALGACPSNRCLGKRSCYTAVCCR